ncbi:peptide-binding protein [Trinickia diaoshuihuensis]|uniref:peptide-binding protein n=1 Tax=Trinickia diaoshuihuensis TaxID=2292265 RepID=UPI001F07DCE2|nr:peptide-binding protein [Trinickia diaoshuihuensis]
MKFIGRWVAVVLCTFAASLALAQPPHGHEGWFAPSRGASLWRAPSRAAGPVIRPSARRAFMMSGNPYGHGAARMVPAPVALPAAMPLRPVSDEARTLAREGGAAYLRAGSIRADIARYNEEREATRPPPPPNGHVPRPPQPPSAYRN